MNAELLRPADDRRVRMVIGGLSGFSAAVVATTVVGDSVFVLVGLTLVLTLLLSVVLTALYRLR